MTRAPEGLSRANGRAVVEALAIARRQNLPGDVPIRRLRVVDHGAAVVVVNGPEMSPPTPPQSRRKR